MKLGLAASLVLLVGCEGKNPPAPAPPPASVAPAVSAAPTAPEEWVTPAQMAPSSPGDGTKARIVSTTPDGTKTWVLVLAPNDDVPSALLAFAKKEKVTAARFTAVGAVKNATVGWMDPARKQYKLLTANEQLEVLTLAGDIAQASSGDTVVHAHASFGKSDGSAWGGHLVKATVLPTVEVFLDAYPTTLKKHPAPEYGIELMAPEDAPPPLAAPAPAPTHPLRGGRLMDPGF